MLYGYKLERQGPLSRPKSREMIRLAAFWGDHPRRDEIKGDDDIEEAIAIEKGITFDEFVERCRCLPGAIPIFENVLTSTWGFTAGVTMHQSGTEPRKALMPGLGPGLYAAKAYWALYEVAHDALQRAITKASYAEFLASTTLGIASVEAFINARASYWNSIHPDRLLSDCNGSRVRFEEKIDNWIPMMTSGKRLDKGDAHWGALHHLLVIRNDHAVHPKIPTHEIQLAKLVEEMNRFSLGIPGILIRLHQLFDLRIPGMIIRDAYQPDLILVEVEGWHI